MKFDLITIFPGVTLETMKYRLGKEVKDPDAMVCFDFLNAKVVTYKYFKKNPKLFNEKVKKFVNEAHDQIIDSAGNKISDYTILIEEDVETENLSAPDTDAQHVLTYLGYIRHIDYWVSVDHVKIMFFRSFGRHIFLNNQREHLRQKYLYMLPIEQHGKASILVRKKQERILLNALAMLQAVNNDLYKRLITALALFNESCYIHPFNANSSIVLIVSALEALLSTPRYGKKEGFSYALKLMFGFRKSIEEWARELYELRSQIVHGDVTPGEKLLASQDRHYPHFKIARDVFEHCLLFVLDDIGVLLVNQNYRRETIKKLQNIVISNKEKVRALLDEKKRFSYKSFKAKPEFYREFLVRIEALTSTDYSARNQMRSLLNIVFKIAMDWMEADRKTLSKKMAKLPPGYADFVNGQYDKINKLFDEIRTIKKSTKDSFKIHDKIQALEEEVNRLEPVIHDKKTFNFTLAEFLDRSLRAIWGIY
jgi:hypothetical protein